LTDRNPAFLTAPVQLKEAADPPDLTLNQFSQHFTRSFCADYLMAYANKLQTKTASTLKFRKTLKYKKAAHKNLVKLTIRKFCVQKCFAQLFSSYILAL
jgi:hypothetical protein